MTGDCAIKLAASCSAEIDGRAVSLACKSLAVGIASHTEQLIRIERVELCA